LGKISRRNKQLKTSIKKSIIKRAIKKRRKNQHFDEVAAELMTLPSDASIEYNNSYYFASHDEKGNAFFFRLGQRGGVDGPIAEIWFGATTYDGKMYMNSQMIYKLDQSPATVKCIEPRKKWEFAFSGKMIPVKPGKDLIAEPYGNQVHAEFRGVFTSDKGIFEFGRDTHIDAFASAMAAEKWTKDFSANMKKNVQSQTRTEQIGHVATTFKVGNDEYTMDAPALRDQAFGKRIWSYMNHYSWLVGSLVDGNAFNVVTVYYPVINVKGLPTGYHLQGDKYINLKDAQFPRHFKTDGIAPAQGSVTAQFSDKSNVIVDFESKIIFPYVFTDDHGGYNVFECITTFNFNGVKGMGIAEFSYNQDKNRLV